MKETLARGSDPETSKEAASNASKKAADAYAAEIVLSVFRGFNDRESLTDEQIHSLAFFVESNLSPDRLRHGRKYLSDRGRLIEAGRAKTQSGASARAWALPETEKETPRS